MNLAWDLRKVVCTALSVLGFVMLFNNQQAPVLEDNHLTKAGNGHFISASNQLSDLFADEDYSIPADNEEDEDEDDDEDGAESLVSKPSQEFVVSISYNIHQDRLFSDPNGELVSPPPKF